MKKKPMSKQIVDDTELLRYIYEEYFVQTYPIVFAEDQSIYYAVSLDILALIYNYPQFGGVFHEEPDLFIQTMKQIFIRVQNLVLQRITKTKDNNPGSVKNRLDIKLINVPPISGEIVAESIRDINNKMLGKQIIVFGTVMRTGNVNSREIYKKFECKSCGKQVDCESDISEYNKFVLPVRCDGQVIKKISTNPFFAIAQKILAKQNGAPKK
jgi:DNA replicative helicase MCM subunit Mcm2 (Cdc46/Mcm family)